MGLKSSIAALAAVLAFAGASAASAATLTENFNESPFGLWQSGWFGANSNAENWYVAYWGSSPDYRGNNPMGLWIADGSGSGKPVTITFNHGFAVTLDSLTLDVVSYIQSTLTIFDASGSTLLSTPVSLGNYSVTSDHGIGGFSFSGAAQGNISLDGVVAITGGVPEPATWTMMLVGFGGLGAYLRRQRRAATLAA